MGLNFESILCDALLELCRSKPLKDIRIADLIARTGVSHQTFYNHFKNKNDLIRWIYKKRIVDREDPMNPPKDYYQSTLRFYNTLMEYRSFAIQACKLDDDGSLKNCMRDFALEWYSGYFKKYWGMEEIPQELEFAVRYNAYASNSMVIHWILHGMTEKPEISAARRVECLPPMLEPYLPAPSKPEILAPSRLHPALAEKTTSRMTKQQEKASSLATKMRFTNALLELCQEKPLDKLTARDLLERTGAGRQTFYRHFRDKRDLIQWTFANKVLYLSPDGEDFYSCWLRYCTQLYQYRQFMEQASQMEGQNNLRDYMISCTEKWYNQQYEYYFGNPYIPEEIQYAIGFHARGIAGLLLDWVGCQFDASPETIANWAYACQPRQLRIYPFIGEANVHATLQ